MCLYLASHGEAHPAREDLRSPLNSRGRVELSSALICSITSLRFGSVNFMHWSSKPCTNLLSKETTTATNQPTTTPHPLPVSHRQEGLNNARNSRRPIKAQILIKRLDMTGSAQGSHVNPELALQRAECPSIEEQCLWEIALVVAHRRSEKNILESVVQHFAQALVRQWMGENRFMFLAGLQAERDPRLGTILNQFKLENHKKQSPTSVRSIVIAPLSSSSSNFFDMWFTPS